MKKILFSIFLSLFALVMNAQTLITTTDVTNINTNHTAFETQIYKDTETNQFYIGLSDGTLKMIGDFSKINSTLSGNGTATSPLGLAQQGANSGQVLAWNGTSWVPTNAAQATTTVSNSVTSPNSLTTTVNGTTGAAVNMVTGVSNTSSNNSLSTTVNGVIGANVNIINSISNSFAGGQLTTTVNGVNATPVTLPSGTVTNVIGTSPITVTNGTTTPNISITRNNIVAGTSSNTATNPLVLDAGATSAVVGGANATLTVNNTAPLWNANQLQGNPVSSNSPSSGQVLSWNGSSWTPTTSTTGWSLTGNSGTAPATNFLGTTDAQRLVFRTNNTEKMTILSGGNVGIGATNPQNKLEITQGTAGNSGLRFTNLPNAGILATNSSGDVIIGKDIKDHHISRANSTSNVAPTSGEIPSPVNGYTAKVKLNNGIIEYWTYTSGAWTLNWSETQTVNGVDIGYIVGWTSNVTPPDYLLPLTGGTYNWSDFPHLQSFHASFPCQYIASSTATTFTLVNINTSGRFLRGGTTAGTLQEFSTAMPIIPFTLSNDTHNHTYDKYYQTSYSNPRGKNNDLAITNIYDYYNSTNSSSYNHSHTVLGGDSETRPINTSVVWCIKVKPTNTTGNITINNITTPQTVTNLTQNTTTGQITYTNENSTNQTARVVSSNANNSIQVGTDGGAYYQKDEIAIDIYNSNTTPQTLTTGSNTLQLNTIRTNLGLGFTLNNNQITVINSGTYRITFSAGITNNAYNGEYTGEYWLELNSNRVRSSTLYQNCYNGSISCSTRDLILELNAGDILGVRMTTSTSFSVQTVPDCNSINIEKIN